MTLLQFLEIPAPAFPAVPPAAAADTLRPSVFRVGRMLLAESRPPVQIVFLLRLVAFAAAVDGVGRLAGTGLLGLAGWSMIWMSVYVFNGVSDVDADRRNGSGRPIASGRLPVGTAAQAAVLLAVTGLGLCALCLRRLDFARPRLQIPLRTGLTLGLPLCLPTPTVRSAVRDYLRRK